ncbi:MAG TPA: RnfABCDGE type electron transport complex subunit A [Fibrobacteraceae bacterium]|nr:RnfABCDGE type electron transport complex subunit A [Fibrobacteraceae bacterium]
MNQESLGYILLGSCIVNNFVLSYFLGICSFLGVSNKLDTSVRLGVAVTFVMLVSSASAFAIHSLLTYLHMEYLQLISFIVVIASTVQLVEMLIKKTSPALFRALGIYLPLITTNCAILAVALFQTSRGYSLLQSLVFALGAGTGFALAMLIMSGIREDLTYAPIPKLVRGTALTLMIAGILSMAFMGFAGMGGG